MLTHAEREGKSVCEGEKEKRVKGESGWKEGEERREKEKGRNGREKWEWTNWF